MQHLPYGGLKWIENFEQDFAWNVDDDSDIGHILEGDVEYPEHIHDSHKDLLFCTEWVPPADSKESKLLTTVLPKNRYIIHYRKLKKALTHELLI